MWSHVPPSIAERSYRTSHRKLTWVFLRIAQSTQEDNMSLAAQLDLEEQKSCCQLVNYPQTTRVEAAISASQIYCDGRL